MRKVLQSQLDFKNEKCAIQKLIENRGHIFLPSVACHPEMAGHGIEFCWGYGEMQFRQLNDQIVKNLTRNVTNALAPNHLTLERIWKFQRRTRDYMRMYRQLETQLLINPSLKDEINHRMLEKKRKDVKNSRLKPRSSSRL